MLSQWRTAHVCDHPAAFEDDLPGRLDVRECVRDKVGMHVAVGDMAPDSVIEAGPLEALPEELQHSREMLKWHDHIRGNLGDSLILFTLDLRNASIDPCRHGLPESIDLCRPAVLSGHDQFGLVQNIESIKQSRQAYKRNIRGLRLQCLRQVVIGPFNVLGRQFEMYQEKSPNIWPEREAVAPVTAILAHNLKGSRIEILDCSHVQPMNMAGATCLQR